MNTFHYQHLDQLPCCQAESTPLSSQCVHLAGGKGRESGAMVSRVRKRTENGEHSIIILSIYPMKEVFSCLWNSCHANLWVFMVTHAWWSHNTQWGFFCSLASGLQGRQGLLHLLWPSFWGHWTPLGRLAVPRNKSNFLCKCLPKCGPTWRMISYAIV